MRFAAGAFACILVVVAGFVLIDDGRDGDSGVDQRTASPPTEVTALLTDFLEARVAGEGAQRYINSLGPDAPAENIPLLYATSSGAPYERAEFEPVLGVKWPYGLKAFKVRLFADDTAVEQLFFVPHDNPDDVPADGRPRLEYQPHGFATNIAPTTEDGQPVAVPHHVFDDEVTLHVAHPWVLHDYTDSGGFVLGRLIPEGPGIEPTTDGGQRIDWDELFAMADPVAVELDDGCRTGLRPADAEALAESIRSYPGLEASAPVETSIGGADVVMMDVSIPAGATVCAPTTPGGDLSPTGILSPVFDKDAETRFDSGIATGRATGERMRLYLFDAPGESAMQILAVAIVAPQSRFARTVAAAAPIADSIEFRTR